MSYTALYRKYRPSEFEDVKGQDHIVTTLKNQIMADRIGHAYLFCGTRGTGKTTIAKIFAKAVNCESPVEGSPCGVCPVCQSIARGSSMNVIEIDAASNNGVDNIREIRDEVGYSPTEGKYKVYIIDEVHMLSTGAFNALLKTLEEPPSYVIFILATTESHKIPTTILSRCQKYDFRRITIDTIADRLRELMEEEGIEVEEKALRYVAKAADGSMRDALSLLDQCIAFFLGQKLTYDHVLEVLGAVDTEIFSRLLRFIMAGDVVGAMAVLEELVIQGRDLMQFVSDFTWYLRNLLLLKSSDDMEEVLDMSRENLLLLKEEAQMIDADVLMRYIRVLSELSGQIRFATQKRVLIEIAVIKLCRPSMESRQDALLDRILQLEKKMEQGFAVAAAPAGTAPSQAAPKVEKPAMPDALPEEIQRLIGNWNNMLLELHPRCRMHLMPAKAISIGMKGQGGSDEVSLEGGSGNELVLTFSKDREFAYQEISSEEQRSAIEETFSKVIGKRIKLIVKLDEYAGSFASRHHSVEDFMNVFGNAGIEVEDEE
ncbi:MAG: DNA polymerase III subunit gamma/tau [Eubacterium sp.]|nr:DNA polymerase III subunit gamma/tau [Eubacterium sp.]